MTIKQEMDFPFLRSTAKWSAAKELAGQLSETQGTAAVPVGGKPRRTFGKVWRGMWSPVKTDPTSYIYKYNGTRVQWKFRRGGDEDYAPILVWGWYSHHQRRRDGDV